MAYNKPLPLVDEDIKPFWEACRRHEFVLWRCKVCGSWYFPPSLCRKDHNEPFFGNMEWARASGKGKVFTFVIAHRPYHPGFRDEVPYVFAMIELDEGPMIGSNIVGCNPYDVRIGMPVEVVFEDATEEFTLPKFRPVQ